MIHQPMQNHYLSNIHTGSTLNVFVDAGTEFSYFLLPLRRTAGGQTEEATAEGKTLVRRFAS